MTEIYDRLKHYLVSDRKLDIYGYPCRDPARPHLRKAKDGQQIRAQLLPEYTCRRCKKVYEVDRDGVSVASAGTCCYHSGLFKDRALLNRFTCCGGGILAKGCCSNTYHVHEGELELANYVGYVETQLKPEREPNRHGVYALDCEMCYTIYGLELTRVTVIDHQFAVVYEKLVKPTNRILDYNTQFSGISERDLANVRTRLADVQRDLLDLFSSKSILIGHSLDSDMKALKLFHRTFIDTAELFPHKWGLPHKRALRTLMEVHLGRIIQKDAHHDSKEDASAALRLVKWKVGLA